MCQTVNENNVEHCLNFKLLQKQLSGSACKFPHYRGQDFHLFCYRGKMSPAH